MTDLLLYSFPKTVRVLLAVLLILVGLWGISLNGEKSAEAKVNDPNIVLITLDGPIDNVSARFINRGLRTAVEQDSELVVLMLNTPGGLLEATRDIVESILVSPVPVVVFVAPEGAQAASAGTFISAAGDILAMSPATNIGAASVVGPDGSELPSTLGRKASQDAAAFIRSIAERRGRNVSALEDTVLTARAYSATEAIELGIADLVAVDFASLIFQLDGYEIEFNGVARVFELADAYTIAVDITLLERILTFISSPSIAFLLVSLGGLGIIVELWNPGMWIPGTLGILFLILGWAGIGQLPFSWAGIGLIALALVLFHLESTAPGIGYFGVSGTISLILGGVFLVGFFGSPGIPGDAPVVNRWLLGAIGLSIGIFVLWFAAELRNQKRITLYQSPMTLGNLIGATGTVSVILSPVGEVQVNGEFWTGELSSGSLGSLGVGENVEVVSVDGLRLTVKAATTGDE